MALTSAGTTNGAEDVLLCKADAIMDGSIQPHIDNFISVALRDCGWDPARPDIPPSVIYPIEVEAISMLLRNYSGLAHICENVAEWCADITFLTQELRGEPPPDEVTKGDAAENLVSAVISRSLSRRSPKRFASFSPKTLILSHIDTFWRVKRARHGVLLPIIGPSYKVKRW